MPSAGQEDDWPVQTDKVSGPAGDKTDSRLRHETLQHRAFLGQMNRPAPLNGPRIEERTQLNRRNGRGVPTSQSIPVARRGSPPVREPRRSWPRQTVSPRCQHPDSTETPGPGTARLTR